MRRDGTRRGEIGHGGKGEVESVKSVGIALRGRDFLGTAVDGIVVDCMCVTIGA